MTLDLGFSCFFMELPERLKSQIVQSQQQSQSSSQSSSSSSSNHNNNTIETSSSSSSSKLKYLQMTLVDCPGHASLIRTIIGGAQIIDVVLLVVDAYKGWQAQTTECLVLAELTAPFLIIALNKIDMFPEHERQQRLEEAKHKVRQRLAVSTKFQHMDIPMIGVSACSGGEKKAAAVVNNNKNSNKGGGGDNTNANNNNTNEKEVTSVNALTSIHDQIKAQTIDVDKLIELLKNSIPAPRRHLLLSSSTSISNSNNKNTNVNTHFYFAIDHCFPIKGMGTVLTGTCLNGTIRVNELIEFPALGNLQRKIKSIQMFKRRCTQISQGDRAGICVSNFDATQLERGVCATPGSVKYVSGCIALVRKIVPHYTGPPLKNKSKYHVSVGHSTVMATVSFWGCQELLLLQQQQQEKEEKKKTAVNSNGNGNKDDMDKIITTTTTIAATETANTAACLGSDADQAGLPYLKFDWDQDFLLQDGLLDSIPNSTKKKNAAATITSGEENSNSHGYDDPSSPTKKSRNKNRNEKSLLHWAILDFQTPVYCPLQSLIIGSRLDTPVDGMTGGMTMASSGGHRKQSKKHHKSTTSNGIEDDNNNDDFLQDKASSCRLAFCGRLIERLKDPTKDMQKIRWYTPKEKRGIVSKLGDPYKRQDDGKLVRYEVYGSELFKKETLLKPFLNMKVVVVDGGSSTTTQNQHQQHDGDDTGVLTSAFGTSGKFRVTFPAGTTAKEGDIISLPFKRFVHDPEKKMRQEHILLPASRSGARIESSTDNNAKKKKNKKDMIETKTGIVDKIKGDTFEVKINDKKTKTTKNVTKYPTAIVSGLFAPEVDIRGEMIGRLVGIPKTKEYGTIIGPFGKAGKCKVSFVEEVRKKDEMDDDKSARIDNKDTTTAVHDAISGGENDDTSSKSSNDKTKQQQQQLNGISEIAVGSKVELYKVQ